MFGMWDFAELSLNFKVTFFLIRFGTLYMGKVGNFRKH